MNPQWFDSRTLYTKVLAVKHGLGTWDVMHPVGAGRGVITVVDGPSATAPPMIAAMLKVDFVWRVKSVPDNTGDYFIITVDKPRHWSNVKAEVEAALARYIE